MLFNSFSYAVFLPIVFVFYWLIKEKYRWIILLCSSYYFYACWNIKYIFLIFFTTLISYSAALLLVKFKRYKKCILILSTIICVSFLIIFKYLNFLFKILFQISNVLNVQTDLIVVNLILPVGISFYTFQTISYVIDVYNEKIIPERNLGLYATYVAFFPQLVAGPIERSGKLLNQIKSPKSFDYEVASYGLKQMVWGFYKKLAIADVLAIYVNTVYEKPSAYKGFSLVLATVFFSIQIYCDFSGYSDIAIGTAKLLGINLTENFKSPYFSSSIKEFWNRWHITLSTWLRDYVYIPLGGNRKGRIVKYRNLIITFLISGLWHGANYTFIVWGAIHGLLLVIEDFSKKISNNKNKIIWGIKVICVFSVCCIAWIFFRASRLSDANYILRNMFCHTSSFRDYIKSGFNDIGLNKYYISQRFPFMVLLPIFDMLSLKIDVIKKISGFNIVLRWLIYFLMIFVILIMMSYSSTSQFIYFQF